MVRNRDLVNRSLLALESKLEALRNCVIKQFPVPSFIQLTEECNRNIDTVKRNLRITRNNDILAKELASLERYITFLREAVDGQQPIEKFITTIERAEQALESIDQAVQREPLEGFELSDPGRVN